MPDLAADEELASSLVRRAGRAAEKMRRAGVAVDRKANRADLVTEADFAAERIIVESLREQRPRDSIIGEEGSAFVGTSGRRWIIDPVDGTWNFVHGLDRWCSAIALVDDGGPLLGAIHKPRAGATYSGGPGLPATRNGSPLPPIVDMGLDEACVATYLHPPALGTEVGDAWQRMVAGAATIRMFGSGSLDLVSVARGQVGVFVQHSVPDWDWYPGAAIVASVGGSTEVVQSAGVSWSVAGAPSAVAAVCEALHDG